MMFTFKTNRKTGDLEMNILNELSLPPLKDCCYTSCYCEENVWKICDYVRNNQKHLLPACYAVFISNRNESVPLWYQKSGKDDNNLAVWDYHVIFLYSPGNNTGSFIYDLDSILPFPCELEKYAPLTFKSDSSLDPCYHRYFRVVPADVFLKTFASDRSRMKKPDGTWIKEPPPYPCITTPGNVFIKKNQQITLMIL
ncbi:Protein N-terminal glutamine amidohydrolase, partial [Stegodyphus mimosarum]